MNTLKKISILKNLAWITFRNKSISFKFALIRSYFSDSYWYQARLSIFLRIKFLLKQVVSFFTKIIENKLTWFFLIPFKKLIFSLLVHQLKPELRIKELLSNYDLIILHSCMMEPELPIILKSIEGLKLKSLMLLENWDNLTSKQILWIKPDFVGVMGPIDKQNVIKIHGFCENQVFSIGLPKFDVLKRFHYLGERKCELKNLLYVGFSLPHNEINLLNNLRKSLNNNEYKLLYRPHPAAKSRLFQEELHSEIQIVRLKKKSSLYEFSEHYMSDVLNSNLVLGAPTTFMLEVMQLGVPFLVDATNDNVHRTTASNSSQNYLHMKQFTSVFSKFVFSDIDELINLLGAVEYNFEELNYNLKKFVHQDDLSYASRLQQIIELIQ